MIKFFRIIRKELMEQNKTSKYLKYAIGEILLVVIGILIALSINNWNESRKLHLADIEFLKNLKTELSLDTIALSKKKMSFFKINNKLNRALQLFNNSATISTNERELISDAFGDLQVLTPTSKNVKSNDIGIVNGSLIRINNTLNQKYQTYLEYTVSNNAIIAKLGESLQLISIHHVSPIFDLTHENSSLKYSFNYDEIKDNRLIKNAIAKSLNYRRISISRMESQIEMATTILSTIDKILDRDRKEN
ncbi:hypothetical protein JYU05_00720 [bacterium AH-315-P13]|nr:hypothetical protein [bacterium AH-315-P13]